ncbi:protein kinase domain-containing protein [Candidatus Protochlamydia naegleriophila]|uniref:protein kinase domain-containing protein n=1 Tax=Candidatus Protochlamydia naegleriophila TaxID=389348 RepID=UPI0013012DF9|nr:protein kinase [Candidatus Protochlamydia naegleriophila]
MIFNHTSTTISEGRFKSVIKVYDLKNPAIYAYALSIPSGDRYVDNYIHKNEEDFLGLFNGTKQIIKVYALHYYGEYQAILMKYYPQDLFGVIEQISRDPVSIAPQIKINYCQQMLETIQLLHAKHVIHRDIKADNFLVEDKAAKGHRLKVADFGLACYDDDQDSLKLVVGTPSYLAPEGWNKNIPARGKPLDIWAAGCVFWMIWKGAAYPWYDHDPEKPDDQEDLMKELLWFHKTRPSPENHLELLLWHMLNPNPEKRWNVELCLDYLNQYGSSFR